MKNRIRKIEAHNFAGRLTFAGVVRWTGAGFWALAAFIAIGFFDTYPCMAQSNSSPKVSFEVASIKPASDCTQTISVPGGGTIRMGGTINSFKQGRYDGCGTLKNFVMSAYQEEPDTAAIEGGPDWIGKNAYRIEAKAEGKAEKAQMRLMLQSLLEERFKLKLHTEARETKVYSLQVAKNGPKLQPAKDDNGNPLTELPPPNPSDGPRIITPSNMKNGPLGACLILMTDPEKMEIRGRAIKMTQLAGTLRNAVGRKVIDKTGLTGLYDIALAFAPDPSSPMRIIGPGTSGPGLAGSSEVPPPAPASTVFGGPSVFKAIQQDLGLKLEENKVPQDYIIIDGAEQPSEN